MALELEYIMSGHGLMSCLSLRQGMNLINIRFFRGGSDVISGDEFRHEVCAAAERQRSGEVKPTTSAPRIKKEPIDLRRFVANM